MKKWLILMLALVLCMPAPAEEYPPIPVELADHALSTITLENAIMLAREEMSVQPEHCQIRAELAKMSDGSYRWVVAVFDLATLSDGWCVELSAASGAVVESYTTHDGFFMEALEKWAAWKGGSTNKALWRMEEKALLDALYALQPMYGLPQPGDISEDEAVERASAALAPYYPEDRATAYLICPGYLMGGDGVNGIWEIYFKEKDLIYQVNLDAVTGEIYYISADDSGNG